MKSEKLFNIGLALLFIGLGIQIAFNEAGIIIGNMITIIGIVLAIRGKVMQKNPEKLKKDERTKKIGAWAASYSWMLTIFVLMILFWINRLFINLNPEFIIGATYIFMIFSLLIFKMYFDKKGDI